MKRPLFTFSCFSGVGGFDFGAKLAGFSSLLRSDVWPKVGEVFELNKDEDGTKNIPEHLKSEGLCWTGKRRGNIKMLARKRKYIRKLKMLVAEKMGPNETIDVIMGGPPCQDQSILNFKREVWTEKNKLVFEYLDFIKEMQPKVALIEQVPASLGQRMKPLLDGILAVIESWGNYYVRYEKMNALDYGSKQDRTRTIFMLVRKDIGVRPSFPKPIPYNKEDVSVKALFDDVDFWSVADFGGKIQHASKPFPTLTARGHFSFFRNGKQMPVTIKEKQTACDLEDLLFGDISYPDASILLGNMVQVNFAAALFNHIREIILGVQ